jgi:hypothetical protein
MMKLKSLIVAAVMLAFAGASMAVTAPAKKHGHKKSHAAKVHKAKHKKAAAAQ